MPPKPRRIRVDGTELVVLTKAAYESLDGQRRQAGAQGARVRALRGQLDQLNAFVDRLEKAAARLPGCPPELIAEFANRPGRDGDRGA
ncbi:hypothetical protein DMC64_18695 [Amycolatopsis sp. WAC 04197]|uniref:hypothetical protein n=1 Tax=Amycolatopsis sp. WAC 04197 TaxID=2203199 RepID=UPI000F7A51CD|nr:hypothetical protein [Amycolatopsis sp. WAC 04197]RSN44915.1 hypothetical protein DMC64_18695 [Amycolatopsis sp. WAC 04197]